MRQVGRILIPPREPSLPSPAATRLYAGCPEEEGPRRAAGPMELVGAASGGGT